VCVAIRRTPALADTYIVILTAKGQLPTFVEDQAPNECMTKPFDPDKIVACAAEVLGLELDF
jgi:DNA-binding response OmpR family regulator